MESIDVAIETMTFEQLVAVKQRACRATVKSVLDACEEPLVRRRWMGSADNRRRLIDTVIARLRERFGGPVERVGMTAEETERWLLTL